MRSGKGRGDEREREREGCMGGWRKRKGRRPKKIWIKWEGRAREEQQGMLVALDRGEGRGGGTGRRGAL
jgi:hypothetical protein